MIDDPQARRAIPVLDIFAGIGGFTLAFEVSGCRTIGFAEIDEYASARLAELWPDVPNFGDVRNVTRDSVLERCGVLPTVITGGFPCQPHSLAGKRGASTDERDEWDECARVLRELRPKCALFENVRGLLTSESGLFLNRVLSDLAELRYACQWQIVSAEDIGAPHRRERIWLLCVDELAYGSSDGRSRSGWQERRELESASGSEPDGRSGLQRELGSTTELADSSTRGRRERGESSGPDRLTDGSGEIVADADSAGWREHRRAESIQTRQPRPEHRGDNRAWPAAFGEWPARPGEPQRWWEPPRVVGDTDIGRCVEREPEGESVSGIGVGRSEVCAGGEIESELGGDSDGLPDRPLATVEEIHTLPETAQAAIDYWRHNTVSTINRVSRLKALGNAIVPGVAVIFARAIYRIESRCHT